MNTTLSPYEWEFFIAHAGPDKAVAEQLYDRLCQDARSFLDSRSLELGDDWDLRLREAQQSSLVTVVLISAHTEQAYYQREEIAAAIALARSDSGHRVVPVYLNSEAATSDSVPYGLRLKHGITLSDSVGLKELQEALLKLRSRLLSDPSPVASGRRNLQTDFAMSIGVEGASQDPWQSLDTTLEYRITRSDDFIRIYPSMPYLDTFNRGGPIDPIAYNYVPFTWDFPNLDFKVVNNGHRTIFLTEVCFDIETSRADPTPILVVAQDLYGTNAGHFGISNEGWGSVRNLRAYFHLTPARDSPPVESTYPHEVRVGDFVEEANVDITSAFERMGVYFEGLAYLSRGSSSWYDEKSEITFVGSNGEEQTVSAKEFRSSCLGDFQDNAGIVSGELVYDGASLDAGVQERRVRFSTVVHIFNEWRAGAPAPSTCQYATKFDTEGADYQRRVGISHVLKPGEADRFNVKIGVDRSSLHSFTVSLIYNDGHELTSPGIELLTFIPRSGAQYASDRPGPLFADEDA